jgi:hypothetical protein
MIYNYTMKVEFQNEMDFAREFWSQAIIGLDDPSEYPPKPDEWLKDGPRYTANWERTKVEMIKALETLTDEDEKKQLKAFLSCTLCLYVDLMCALSKMKESEDNHESIDSFIFKLDESSDEEQEVPSDLESKVALLPKNEERTEVITSESGLPNITV